MSEALHQPTYQGPNKNRPRRSTAGVGPHLLSASTPSVFEGVRFFGLIHVAVGTDESGSATSL
jgi:hypothetical protein